jgi:diaminohydroxyphosphoribosylaminopyrimidine deaminase / 5-amino-6-(5-phosphoribosylamino)uracil reductase
MIRIPSDPAKPELDLSAVLHALCEKGISRLMVEGGARVAASFVAAGLADEIWLLRGPATIGVDGVSALDALPLAAITQSPAFRVRASETLDKDTLTIYERA